MTTAAAPLRPVAPPTADLRPGAFRRRSHRRAAHALVLAGLTIPLTGAGSAVGATHAPAQVKVAAVADAVVGVVATGKHDV